MADFISFRQGRKDLASNGMPATLSFDLSTRDCATHTEADTYAGGFGVATGTGYAAQTEAEPTPTTASPTVIAFAIKTWSTGVATDWPASVKSVVMSNGSNVIYCAWNLQAGGAARVMNAASTTENYTPTLTLA